MSDHIPFEIQAQIMKRLPAKKLIQSKMVSKQWKSLIESSRFMTAYNLSKTGPSHLFIRFVHSLPDSLKPLYNRIDDPRIVGSSHGLFCLYGDSTAGTFTVIWNPSINKCIAVDMGMHFDGTSKIGFGVRPDTLDPMIVKIDDDEHTVEVFRLSTGVWTNRRIDLPRESIAFTIHQVDVNGFIYWSVFDMVACHLFIVSFDMKSDKFSEVNLPKCFTSTDKHFSISKLRESLVVLEDCEEAETQKNVCAIWMMLEDGAEKSFTKLYTISTQDTLFRVLGFRKSGKPIVGTRIVDDERGMGVLLSVYDPHSRNIDGLATHRLSTYTTLFVSSYTETLLLLDHPNKPIPYQSQTIH
uniref:putative F-box protein At1g32420 n=1 Tax=Erigeron canadensis TaxID=72917 RepID=UPI001CB99F31|nr:putative F-box protein At1g32420 [Erigeron canadensis]